MAITLGWLFMVIAAIMLAASDRVRRIGCYVGGAGVCTTALAALVLLVSGQTWSWASSWPIPIGGIILKADVSEALMILLVQIIGALILLCYSSDAQPWDMAAMFLLMPALGVCLTARDVVLFLIAWEVMALCGVVWQRGRGLPEDQYEGHGLWAYLISAHLATCCLFILLPLLAKANSGPTFQPGQPIVWDVTTSTKIDSPLIWLYVALTIAGFGTKAGLAPFHPWIRSVYRNAPARFGAASSGLMAKVSLFLMIRTLVQLVPLLGPARLPVLAGLLMVLGIFSGILGLSGALSSARIKVVLGYSSIENVGIIVLGFGLGLWGVSREAWTVAALGFSGAWLHLINHMLSKTLLFLATVSVAQATSTDDLARLGGLLKRMPVTGRSFGLGAMSLAAMVPLNAFNSELLIYKGLFLGVLALGMIGRDMAIISVAAMGLIGGLAAVCFGGVWGLGFLGNARSEDSANASESALKPASKWAMNSLCILIMGFGLLPFAGFKLAWLPSAALLDRFGAPAQAKQAAYQSISTLLLNMTIVSVTIVVLVLLLKRWRDARLAKSSISAGPTWDCGFGYTDTFPRGQYSGLSFFEPLLPFVGKCTWLKPRYPDISEPFPARLKMRVESADGLIVHFYDPLFRFISGKLAKLRWIQAGSIQLYLAMMTLTLVAMLVWLILI